MRMCSGKILPLRTNLVSRMESLIANAGKFPCVEKTTGLIYPEQFELIYNYWWFGSVLHT